MKVKIEFDVNAPTSKLLKCLYDRLDILHTDLIHMDSNFKDIYVEIITHRNECINGDVYLNFHNGLPKKYVLDEIKHIKSFDLYGGFCDMFHDGTCWGTMVREKCACGGLKKFCTYYHKGE